MERTLSDRAPPSGERVPAPEPLARSGDAPRSIRVFVRTEWQDRGLLGSESRVRTLRKVLVTYPEVRHVLPDRVSLESTSEPRVLESLARFLERQQWLVKSVVIE